jgi:hypothetical protein
VIITILVTIAVAVAGTQLGGLTGIGGLPQIPVDGSALTERASSPPCWRWPSAWSGRCSAGSPACASTAGSTAPT